MFLLPGIPEGFVNPFRESIAAMNHGAVGTLQRHGLVIFVPKLAQFANKAVREFATNRYRFGAGLFVAFRILCVGHEVTLEVVEMMARPPGPQSVATYQRVASAPALFPEIAVPSTWEA